MAINENRPIITYENIALFQSDSPAHSAASNSGDGLSFLPLVQGIDFSVDIPRTNAGALGTKGFVDQSNRNAPDVQISVNTIENFGGLFSGLVSGDNVRDNLNIDRNFYAIVGNERGFDVSGENLSNRNVLSFGNCFLNNISISQSVDGVITSSYSYVGSNIEAEEFSLADEDITSFKVSGIGAVAGAGDDGAEDQSAVFVPSGTFGGETQWASASNNHVIQYESNVTAWFYKDSDDQNPFYAATAFPAGFPWNATWSIDSNYGDALAGTLPQFYDFVGENNFQIKSPSFELTGNQSQNIDAIFSEMSGYYSNDSKEIIQDNFTNITIKGSGSVGNFLIKSDSIQSFNLDLPINRKAIYSLGKKYPLNRKALFPSEGSFNFSNRVSNFEVTGDRANLKDFLNSDESYTINISGKDGDKNSFNLRFSDAKLTSQSYSSSIGSDIVANLGFSFGLNNFQGIFRKFLLNSFPGSNLALSTRRVNPDYTGYAMRVRSQLLTQDADVAFDENHTISLSSKVSGSDTTLADFLGSNDGYVTTWYDQSNSGNHYYQSTENMMPTIVKNGVVVTGDLGLPAVSFDGENDRLSGNGIKMNHLTTVCSFDTSNTSANNLNGLVGKTAGTRSYIFVSNDNGAFDNYAISVDGNTSDEADVFINSSGVTTFNTEHKNVGTFGDIPDKEQTLITVRFRNSDDPNTNMDRIGSFNIDSSNLNSLSGLMSEFISYTDTGVDTNGIESNINSYYKIF